MKERKTVVFHEVRVEPERVGFGTLVDEEVPQDQGKKPFYYKSLVLDQRSTRVTKTSE